MSVLAIRGSAMALPLPDDSVDLVVTSPPYFGLRSYTDGGEAYDGQVGSEATPAEFIEALLAATREMVRVLKPSGSIFVNLGDKYAGQAPGPQGGTSGTSGRGWARERANYDSSVKAKSLMGLPWRYALRCIDTTQGIPPQIVREMVWQVYAGELHPDACEAIIAEYETGGRNAGLGLILRQTVIWSKPNGMPESATDRTRRCHEDWFHFTLNPRYYSAIDEIRDESQQGRPQATRAAALAERAGLTDAHREALRARGLGDVGRGAATQDGTGKNTPEILRLAAEADAALGGYTREFLLSGPALGKLPGSVWTIPTEPLDVPGWHADDHYAAFPTEWPKRIIQGWSPARICTACGEGRRPVSERQTTFDKARDQEHATEIAARGAAHGVMSGGTAKSTLNGRTTRTISGEACACTPRTSHRGEGDWREGREIMPEHGSDDFHSPGNAVPRRPGGFGTKVPASAGEWEYHFDDWTPPPTTPGVVLDPFGGTGTAAHVADALGRHGISVDLSAGYSGIAADDWMRRQRLAKVKGLAKPPKGAAPDMHASGTGSLFEVFG